MEIEIKATIWLWVVKHSPLFIKIFIVKHFPLTKYKISDGEGWSYVKYEMKKK